MEGVGRVGEVVYLLKMLEDDQQHFPMETRNSFDKVRVTRVSRQRDPGGKSWKDLFKVRIRCPALTIG